MTTLGSSMSAKACTRGQEKRIHQARVRTVLTVLTVLTVPTVPTYASAPCSSYRLSFRYSVEGSIPSTSAARVLLPPSAWSTHMM